MSRSNKPHPCIQCGRRQTRSATRVCWECRQAPAVRRDGEFILVEGLGLLTTDAALVVSNAIVDAIEEGTP
jgi:hypothetical protein